MLYRLLSSIAAATFAMALSQTHGNSVELIVPGVFHGDEVAARTGERWIGLAPNVTGFQWRSFAVSTRRVHDAVIDDPGEKTGIEVLVSGGQPLFLLRGLDLLGRSVRVDLYSPNGLVLPDKDALVLSCPYGAYKLRVVNRRLNDDDPIAPSRLLLESAEGVQQTLYEWPNGLLDQHCEIFWAGDLDGDGKLDLFMNLSDHYNVTESTLYLSSKAAKGKLVERTAVFWTRGC